MQVPGGHEVHARLLPIPSALLEVGLEGCGPGHRSGQC